ncbi:hypothetical protein BH18ACI3_BH18ACI3_17420 [soil metagenome]
MLDLDTAFINEEFHAEAVSGIEMDDLLANGWRHFGTHFFRYNLNVYEFDIRQVIPLRIRLADFSLTKSQRRILRKNADLRTEIRPIVVTDKTEELFERHKLRFHHGTPDSIYDFVSRKPAKTPCRAMEICVYEDNNLLAASFLDIAETSSSGIYAIFDPKASSRSPGIFTMLKEIEYSIENGKMFYYQGYCYAGESFYDYKKRFRAIEQYEWNGNWESVKEFHRPDAETLSF